MNIPKWLARRGAVGGTARWSAKMYKSYREQYPDKNTVPDTEIYRLMIDQRYQLTPDSPNKKILLSSIERLNGLGGFTVHILTVEAGFSDHSPSVRSLFNEVIREEIEELGFPSMFSYS